MKLTIHIKDGTALTEVEKLKEKLTNTAPLMKRLGEGLQNSYINHFDKLNKIPNKRGWKKSNFWAKKANATSFVHSDSNSASIAISDGKSYAIKVHGGTIRPTGNRKYLAIPACESRYGISPKSADDRDDLFFRKTKSISYLAKKDGKAYRVQYWLVRKVEQKPDPNALPDENDILTQAKKTIKRYLLK